MVDINFLKSLTAEQLDKMEEQELRDAVRILVETISMLATALEGQKNDDE
jgi:hypothetical protein